MKVKELLSILQKHEPEDEIKVGYTNSEFVDDFDELKLSADNIESYEGHVVIQFELG